MSCWVDLVVLPQIHVDSLSFSIVSWYLWHVHHCWPMHSMSHFHCIMDHYGSCAVDTCGLYILWHCLMVSTAFLSYLLLYLNSITLGALGLIKWFCHIHVRFYYPLALSHGVCGISIFLSILHQHPCSADSHLSGCTFATMSCWVDLMVLPQIYL